MQISLYISSTHKDTAPLFSPETALIEQVEEVPEIGMNRSGGINSFQVRICRHVISLRIQGKCVILDIKASVHQLITASTAQTARYEDLAERQDARFLGQRMCNTLHIKPTSCLDKNYRFSVLTRRKYRILVFLILI